MAMVIAAPVHAYLGAINRHDIEAAVDLFTDDAVYDGGPIFDHPYVGPAAIRGLLTRYLRSLPGLSIFVRDIFTNGGDVFASVEMYATTGANPDPSRIPGWKEGRKLSWRGALLFSVTSDSKIRSVRVFGDQANARWLPAPSAPG